MSHASFLTGEMPLLRLGRRGMQASVVGPCSSSNRSGSHSLAGPQRALHRPAPDSLRLRLQCRAVAEPPTDASKDAAAKPSGNSFSLEGLEAAYSGRGAEQPSTSQVYKPAQGQKLYLQGRKKPAQGPIRMAGKGRRGGKRVEITERLSKVLTSRCWDFADDSTSTACMAYVIF